MTIIDQQDTAELRTLVDLVRWGASRFNEAGLVFGHGTDNAVDESLALVLHALHLDHSIPDWLLGARITDIERQRVAELFRRRIEERLPLAYITNKANFCDLEFYIDERVLIPRSPIAELVQQGFQPWLTPGGTRRILDLCTGSGCIAIALARAFPEAEIVATDISDTALQVAAINVHKHQLEDRVKLIKSDLFDQLPVEPFELIVSNPPYVDAATMASLAAEFRHEPVQGLAGGQDGLTLVTRMLRSAGNYLSRDGVLVVEVGNSDAALAERFPDLPFTWLDFERSEGGVFLLTAAQLAGARPQLMSTG